MPVDVQIDSRSFFCNITSSSSYPYPSFSFQRLIIDSPDLASFTFDDLKFSVDLKTFLGSLASTAFGSSNISLDAVFTDLQTLLGNIASYGPNVTAGSTPTELEGLFDIINDAKDFADGLLDFIDVVDKGECLIA